MEDEYELVPLGPIRKLEKRVEVMEKSATSEELFRQMLNIVKANQQVVDNMSKTNSHIVNKVAELSTSVEKLMGKIDGFIERIELSEGAGEEDKKKFAQMEERIEKMEKNINKLILSRAPVRRAMQRPIMSRPPMAQPLRRPLARPPARL